MTDYEKLFPFVLKSRGFILGRDSLLRNRKKLEFILITTDLSQGSRSEIMGGFSGIPILEAFTSIEVEKFFGFRGTKVVGFRKSQLSKAILQSMEKERPRLKVEPKPKFASAITDKASPRSIGQLPAKRRFVPTQRKEPRVVSPK